MLHSYEARFEHQVLCTTTVSVCYIVYFRMMNMFIKTRVEIRLRLGFYSIVWENRFTARVLLYSDTLQVILMQTDPVASVSE